MTYSEDNGTYLIRLMPGEELIETLTAFCKDKGIMGGTILGLGGSTDAALHYFNQEAQEYVEKEFKGKLFEVANFTGNISAEKLHIHMTIGDDTYKAYAGHCSRLVADPTLEVTLIPFKEVHRSKDEYSGLDLLDLDSEFKPE